MRREIETLATRPFDVLVVGGGIVGACAAWDAALRGLSVALVERRDFAGGTSSNSLKIVHTGIRDLGRADLRRMRESILESTTWFRIAPHLVTPLPVVVPAYRTGVQRAAALRLLRAAFDAFTRSEERRRPGPRPPPGRHLTRGALLDLVPELDHRDLSGGILFHDGQMYSSERLVLDVVEAASRAGATVANYVECEGPARTDRRGGAGPGARLRDRLGNARFDARARVVINAAGPAAAAVAGRFGCPIPRAPAYSIALNIMVEGLGHSVAFAVSDRSTGASRRRGRRFFVVPWRGRSILGTAHGPYDGDLEAPAIAGAAIDRFLDEANRAWPGRRLTPDDLVLVHAGLLPAARSGHGMRLLRRDLVRSHAPPGAPGLVNIVTVKLTTARLAAERAVDEACRCLGIGSVPGRTAMTPLPGAPAVPIGVLAADARRRYAAILDDDTIEHLVRTYGAGYERIIAYRDLVPEWNHRVVPGAPVILAQFLHGTREEMAQRPEDLVYRRTEIGATGRTASTALAAATDALARSTAGR